MQTKKSRRQLVREASLQQTLLRTIAAILIEHDGELLVTRENMMMASNLRVDAQPTADGHTRLRLQDEDGTWLPSQTADETVDATA